MHRQDLLQRLQHYQTTFMEEAAMVRRTVQFILAHEDCFNRELMHGHVTGSAWVLNPQRTHTLMLHHRKLLRWFQPGGHADGDPDILQVILKEVSEESGVELDHIKLLSEEVFDVDIHTIYPSEHDERHQHYDIRFLLEIDDRLELPGNSESLEVGWIPLHQVSRFNNMRSLHRMVRKTEQRFRPFG